jgi:aspartyl-tRNA(Asn)/glutamyl-tRNA(Gln) amidotransferase subunit A
VFEASAKEQALAVDEKIKNGTAGRLAGMVIGIKDNLCYKGHKVSAASISALISASSVLI